MWAGASAELLRPIDGMDEYPERVLAQAIDIARGIEDDGQDGGPTLSRSQRGVLVSALDAMMTWTVLYFSGREANVIALEVLHRFSLVGLIVLP